MHGTNDSKNLLKKKVLILSFLNHSNLTGREVTRQVAREVENAVLNIPDLIPIAEDVIDGYEEFAADENEYNYRLIFAKARAYGISAVISGTIENVDVENRGENIGLFRTQDFDAAATIKVDLFDAISERSILSKVSSEHITEERSLFFWNRSAESDDSSRGKLAVTKALEKILRFFPEYAKRIGWTGRIAKVDMHRYYINAGEATGISRGQFLKVFGESDPVVDPQTGLFIGLAPGRFKGVLKVIDHFGSDGAVAVLQSGGGIREQDRVEVFSPPENR